MAFRPFLTADIIALITLATAFFIGLKLRKLMGKGKDTEHVKLMLIVIGVNVLLGLLLLLGGYQKFIGEYANYSRLTDIMLMIIGIVLAISLYQMYNSYSKLIKKHEPNL